MSDFKNLIFFAFILLHHVSKGNCLKCYECSTLDDIYDCDNPRIKESNDTDSGHFICLELQYFRAIDHIPIYTKRTLFKLPSERHLLASCTLANAAPDMTKDEEESCVICDSDLCNASPKHSQESSSDSTAKHTSSSTSIRLQKSSFGVAMAGIFLNVYKIYVLQNK